ncbi:MAG: acetyl-CoA carboxylase carboxyl transferase subunit alpha, partial [Thermoguttaceae bacterium]
MSAMDYCFTFEKPIYELEDRLEKLGLAGEQTPEVRQEIRRLRRERVELIKQIYKNLSPWEIVEVARHPERPTTTDYLGLIFDEFVELHGDRCFGDDRALRTGFA